MFIHSPITVYNNADKSCPQALWANGGHKIHWAMVNPVSAEGTDEEKLAVFRQVRDEIDADVQAWLRGAAPRQTTA
jgi:arsenate reductase